LSKTNWGFFEQNKKLKDAELVALKNRVDRKNQPSISLEDFTGDYFNTIYGRVTISKSGNMLICRLQHHPELTGFMEYMDNNEFRLTYSNIGYGVHAVKFSFRDGKPVGIEIKVNDFVEYDSYLFVKDPQGIMIK